MLIGHKRIWEHLIKSAKSGRLAHAYLFLGPEGLGKKTLAVEFAKWLLCQKQKQAACGQCRSCLDLTAGAHPDAMVLAAAREEKDGVLKNSEIGIDEIRELQHRLGLSPYYSEYKAAVVDEIGNLTREAANSFLKTLEEPKGKSLIFLTSSSWQSVLPTIISRCQTVKFSSVPEAEIISALEEKHSKAKVAQAVKISAGRPGKAIEYLENPELAEAEKANGELLEKMIKSDLPARFEIAARLSQNAPETQKIMAQWILALREGMLKNYFSGTEQKNNLPGLIREIAKTRAVIGNSSFNAKLALEVFMTRI